MLNYLRELSETRLRGIFLDSTVNLIQVMLAEGSFLFSSTKEVFLMKVIKIISFFLSLFVVIMSFFGPLVICKNQAIPTYFVLFCTEFNVFKLILFGGYLLLLGGIGLFFFIEKPSLDC